MKFIDQKTLIQRAAIAFLLLFCTTFATVTYGQDTDKELLAFAQKYQEAYNKEDHATLKTFYTTDARRIAQDTIVGAEAIRTQLEAQFKSADATIQIVQEKVSWSDFNHAFVSSGTYHLKGKNTAGKAIDFVGKFSNVMLKQNGIWKISTSFLNI